MTTYDYGNWTNFRDGSLTIEDSIGQALRGISEHFNVKQIIEDYRDLINVMLPSGMMLCGNTMYGNKPDMIVDYEEIRERAESRFWEIAEKNEI